jgi:outer membrane immunogenic protein
MIKHSAAAGLALALVAGSALAADLPSRKAPIIEPPPPPPFTWTGLYGGVNIGYGFGNGDQDTGALGYYFPAPAPNGAAWTVSNNLNGVLGGGQVGYNYQFNPWLVIGVEADIQATDVHSQGTGYGASADAVYASPRLAVASVSHSVDWFGTVRARLGVTLPSMPNLLVYGTGGFAYGGVVANANVTNFWPAPFLPDAAAGSNYDSTATGWTAGGGVEWFPLTSSPLFKAFSVKLEYLYTDLGTVTLQGGNLFTDPAPSFFAFQHSSATRFHTVRVGVNWHFNPFAPAPVVLAKY